MRSQEIDRDEWVDAETACAMLGGIAPRTLRHLAAEDKIMRVVLPGPKQTRVYFKPDIERILAERAPAPVARHKHDDQQVLAGAPPTPHADASEGSAAAGAAPCASRSRGVRRAARAVSAAPSRAAQARLLEDAGAQR
jgi:hypothetical protein